MYLQIFRNEEAKKNVPKMEKSEKEKAETTNKDPKEKDKSG